MSSIVTVGQQFSDGNRDAAGDLQAATKGEILRVIDSLKRAPPSLDNIRDAVTGECDVARLRAAFHSLERQCNKGRFRKEKHRVRELLAELLRQQGEQIPTLNRVDPKKNLALTSCPCERQAAYIRNQSVDAMEVGNAESVAFRYLQSRQGQRNTTIEAASWAIGSVAGAPCLLHVLPNVGNAGRYRKTKRACKTWLIDNLGEAKFAQIQALRYNRMTVSKDIASITARGGTRMSSRRIPHHGRADIAAELRGLSRDNIADLLVSGEAPLRYDVATETCQLTRDGDNCADKAKGNNR